MLLQQGGNFVNQQVTVQAPKKIQQKLNADFESRTNLHQLQCQEIQGSVVYQVNLPLKDYPAPAFSTIKNPIKFCKYQDYKQAIRQLYFELIFIMCGYKPIRVLS
ncbi:UNKNOWN [Stylonychia lemnae]|uniref:Uncharacterized protein n=1 Tax=Stylonychia lemnae TaxID=5949 RepID=A0A077ZXI8_STYLE|nr:UNKNOWN [Stylonychia lemnae]|eukprot:CDW74276.1 UNKNOWN [Stylonychia lemnae]